VDLLAAMTAKGDVLENSVVRVAGCDCSGIVVHDRGVEFFDQLRIRVHRGCPRSPERRQLVS
jgi:hypothetical protein